MLKKIIKVLLVTAGLALTGVATAGIVYDNGSADHVFINGIPISDSVSWGEDDFSFETDTFITDVHFTVYGDRIGVADITNYGIAYGLYAESAAGGFPDYTDFLISDYIGAGITVDSTGFSAGVGFDEYLVSFDLPNPVVALGGVTYWLTVQTFTVDGQVFWAASDGLAGNAVFHPGGDPEVFTPALQEMAFQLTGPTVPIPGTLFLIGIGIAAVATRRWKQA